MTEAAERERRAARTARPGRFPPALVAAGLAAAILLVWFQLHSYDFINFDDDAYVYANPAVRAGLTRAGVRWALTTFDYFYWQPLTWLTHMADCQLFGLDAGRHHLGNVLLHACSALLLFFTFRRMTGALWRSAAAAALWALHPLRVESVSWIAERKDVLAGFWFAVLLWAYARHAGRPGTGRYALVVLAMALGLMSKPMLVTAPLLLLLLDYWPLGRRAVAEKLPLALLAVLTAAMAYVGQGRMGAMAWGAGIPFSMRAANAVVSCARYLAKSAWPEDLAILYPYPASFPAWQVAGAAALVAGITAACLWWGRRKRYLAAGWLWFTIGLLPTIGLVQVGRQAMADRFTYLPSIGLTAAAVWGLAELGARRPKLAAACAACAVAALGTLSWRQAHTWRDSIAVFSHAIAVTPPNSLAEHDLAVALEDAGRRGEALAHYAAAVRIEPGYFIAQANYATALWVEGDREGAERHFREAIGGRPDYADACYRLGRVLERRGRGQEGEALLARAMALGLTAGEAARAEEALAHGARFRAP